MSFNKRITQHNMSMVHWYIYLLYTILLSTFYNNYYKPLGFGLLLSKCGDIYKYLFENIKRLYLNLTFKFLICWNMFWFWKLFIWYRARNKTFHLHISLESIFGSKQSLSDYLVDNYISEDSVFPSQPCTEGCIIKHKQQTHVNYFIRILMFNSLTFIH